MASACLRSNDCLALASGLMAHGGGSLTHLDLSHNDIGVVGCAALGFLLDPVTCDLRHLLLAWNNMTSQAAEHILYPLVPRKNNVPILITLDPVSKSYSFLN